METILTQPSATPVMQALRSIGYKPKTAIADLIDNCIDAKSTLIQIEFLYEENAGLIIIKDNGVGMSEEELQLAMNIGSKDPRDTRKPNELGRFGMGLKTAAFSLGKRLSVLTKKNGCYFERCWDLDYVSECNEWQLFKNIPDSIKNQIGELDEKSGTIVCIDKLDRFIGYGTSKIIKNSSFYKKVDGIKKHLELIFHSLLSESLIITINSNEVTAWDPFLLSNPKITEGECQIFRVNQHKVVVTPYVLPHFSTFNEMQYRKAGGVKGWQDQQGFYIYRENRLLYFGDWLGMFAKDSASQLARIRIDLSNASDDDWHVDVKKSTISIPEDARIPLKNIAERYRQVSREIFYFRTKSNFTGQKIKGSLNTWQRIEFDHGAKFKLNRTNPILCEILNKVDDHTTKLLNVYLKSVELGSPSNIIDIPKVDEEKLQIVDDSTRRLVIEFAKIFIDMKLAIKEEQLINIFLTHPGFEKINELTLKSIFKEEKIFYA
ncbi:ATP-binding protein [Brevibacillus laterosporus]|uniref:ATP-binding protein n=1 Tax=Brevibacillus laterosporus TaxID=1465 RepID=UPI000BCE4F92|nr:ATP-binding protein [Brevibacillus laterosporus]PCN43649.1 ATP-binding protein [Brevibacillus laterosporus]